MRAELEQWESGWYGLALGMSAAEIDRLITQLSKLKADPDQHFHISSDYKGKAGLGDIEVYVKSPEEKDNMHLSSLAIAPNG